MRADQLVNLLHRLKLKPASKRAAEALGLSVRQLQRLTAGTVPVPKPVALLAIAYSKLEYVPNPLWNLDADRTDAIEEVSRRAHATLKYRAVAPAPPLPSPTVAPEPTLVVSRGAPFPTAPEPAVVQAPEPQREPPKAEPAPEPPPIRSTTRRRPVIQYAAKKTPKAKRRAAL
jgi:hypothetical protein